MFSLTPFFRMTEVTKFSILAQQKEVLSNKIISVLYIAHVLSEKRFLNLHSMRSFVWVKTSQDI